MAALKEIVKSNMALLHEGGTGYLVVYKVGRSWYGVETYLDASGKFSKEELEVVEEIVAKDPGAVLLNCDYNEQISSCMSLNEMVAAVRWCYENGANRVIDFYTLSDERLQDTPKQDLSFCERVECGFKHGNHPKKGRRKGDRKSKHNGVLARPPPVFHIDKSETGKGSE